MEEDFFFNLQFSSSSDQDESQRNQRKIKMIYRPHNQESPIQYYVILDDVLFEFKYGKILRGYKLLSNKLKIPLSIYTYKFKSKYPSNMIREKISIIQQLIDRQRNWKYLSTNNVVEYEEIIISNKKKTTSLYIVMEDISSGILLEESNLSYFETKQIISQACNIFQYLDEAKISFTPHIQFLRLKKKLMKAFNFGIVEKIEEIQTGQKAQPISIDSYFDLLKMFSYIIKSTSLFLGQFYSSKNLPPPPPLPSTFTLFSQKTIEKFKDFINISSERTQDLLRNLFECFELDKGHGPDLNKRNCQKIAMRIWKSLRINGSDMEEENLFKQFRQIEERQCYEEDLLVEVFGKEDVNTIEIARLCETIPIFCLETHKLCIICLSAEILENFIKKLQNYEQNYIKKLAYFILLALKHIYEQANQFVSELNFAKNAQFYKEYNEHKDNAKLTQFHKSNCRATNIKKFEPNVINSLRTNKYPNISIQNYRFLKELQLQGFDGKLFDVQKRIRTLYSEFSQIDQKFEDPDTFIAEKVRNTFQNQSQIPDLLLKNYVKILCAPPAQRYFLKSKYSLKNIKEWLRIKQFEHEQK